VHETMQTAFGMAISGSLSIQPQMHQTNALIKLEATKGPEIALLSF